MTKKKSTKPSSPKDVYKRELAFAEPYEDEGGCPGFAIPCRNGIDIRSIDEWRRDNESLGTLLENRFTNCFWPLPGRPDLESDFNDLTNGLTVKVHRFIYDHVEFLKEEQYPLATNWVCATYWTHLGLRHWPRLIFHGVTGSGKSTAMDTLRAIAYRGWEVVSPTGPALYRTIEMHHPTIFLDEYQNLSKQKERQADIDDLIIAGFDPRGVIIRCQREGDEVDQFRPFGPMAIGTRRLPGDDKQNRSIVITMVEKTRDLRRRIDAKEAKEIRTSLISVYLKLLYEEIDIGGKIDSSYERAESFNIGFTAHPAQLDSRSIDMAGTLLLPSYILGNNADIDDVLIEVMRGQDVSKDYLRGGMEAQTFYALQECVIQAKRQNKIDAAEFDPMNITTRDVSDQLNKDLQDQGNESKERMSTNTVTANIKTLGFQIKRQAKGHNLTSLDRKGFEEIYKRNLSRFGARDELN